MTSHVTDIRIVYDDGKPIGVIMDWSDGTKTKAICEKSDRDNFNLDFGLTICMTKKMIDFLKSLNLIDHDETYMKAIDSYHRLFKKKEASKNAEKERIKAKNEAKQKARQDEARKKREEREREIEIQKEAYLRAMKEYYGDWWKGVTNPGPTDWWYTAATKGTNDFTFPDHG